MYIGIDIDVTGSRRLHNVIFADDFRGNIEEIFEGDYRMILLFMCMFLRLLTNLLHQGQTGIYVLMPTPELKTGSGIDWSDEALTDQIKDVIYRKLATIEVFEDIKSHIVSRNNLLRQMILTNVSCEIWFGIRFNANFSAK